MRRLVLIFLAMQLCLANMALAGSREDSQECDKADERPELAIPACSRIIEQKGEGKHKTAIAYNNRCVAKNQLRKFDEALDDCSNAIRLHPKLAFAFHNRGYANLEKGVLESAIADYDKSIALNPSNGRSLHGRGKAYSQSHEYDKAIADFSAAIALYSDYADAYEDRGNAYMMSGHTDSAIADFSRVVALSPGRNYSYLRRAEAFLTTGQHDSALSDLTRIIEIASGEPISISAYELRADVYEKKGEWIKVAQDLEKRLARIEANPVDHARVAMAWTKAGKPAYGLRNAETAAQLLPKEPKDEPLLEISQEIWNVLASTQEALSQNEAATSSREKAKAIADKLRKLRADRSRDLATLLAGTDPRGTRFPTAGNPVGDVTLVEFFDYNCQYCRRAINAVIKLIGDDKNVKVVFLDFPVLSKESKNASRVALAADKQGKYWEVHKELLGSPGHANEAKALEIAERLGLDMDRIRADMKSAAIGERLDDVVAQAARMGINGTPHFVVGLENIAGAPENLLDVLRRHVAAARN